MPLGKVSGWVAQIQTLERRIGRVLPPSYRTFLAESNGFHEPGMFIGKMYSTGEVDWFHVRNPWANKFHEPHQNLAASLQVSGGSPDGETILLNPDKVEGDGEWQTYFFGSWAPGAQPYRDFGSIWNRN